ncbi:MAG TPA: response regulator transcription factor [Trebonia sp.]|nr:response regulator transcription factor [Trebonia sp.]
MSDPAEPPLRVIIADDQASVREGLVLLLGMVPGIEVTAAAVDGQQALDLVAEHHPDAILLDLHMPVVDGIQATRMLTAEHPEVAIVILTTYADDTSIMSALRAGARSYLTKDANRADIARALHSAARGLSVMDPAVQATLVAAAGAGSTPDAGEARDLPDGLTPREAEILALIARGMTNPEIAATLILSNHTVKSHINRIFAKTGSRDRAAATQYAHAHDL